MERNLQKLSRDWNCIDSIVLYGAGINAEVIKDVFSKLDLTIPFVIDRDKSKQGKLWYGIPVVAYKDVERDIRGKKIVIMTAHTAYNQISDFLNRQGFKENVDYCGAGQFLCEWFWNVKKMNCIYHVDMTVTTRCTFRCKNCNMFIPYYKKHMDYDFRTLKRNVDLFFERIDYVAYFGLIGGETLLSPVLPELVQYISETYHGKFGRISFTTNGNIMPSDEVLHALKDYDVYLTISDYTKQIPYGERFRQVLDKLEEVGVSYEIKYALEWCDFGFPTNPYHYNEEKLKEHLKCCNPEWNGLNDGRFYYCNIAWSAEKSGIFKLDENDYIQLESIDACDREACRRIVELSRGMCSFCRVCGGCGSDNVNYVMVGEQM